MTDQELKEIRERCGPGELVADHRDTPFYNNAEGHSRGGDPTDDWYVCSDGEIIYDHLNKTAALLLTDIPKLLDEIDRLNKQLNAVDIVRTFGGASPLDRLPDESELS